MKKLIFLNVLIVLLFSNCQKVVDADELLDAKERVSIIGYLSPSDTILRVAVSKALPAIGTPIKWQQDGDFPEEFLITDALVSISNDSGDLTVLTYNAAINAYIADANSLAIEVGKDYFLKVKVGDKEFNASCTIPKKVTTINETINFRTDTFGQETANINISFTDFKEEDNYYVLGGDFTAILEFEDEEPFEVGERIFFDTNAFMTDNLTDGNTLNASGEIFFFSYGEELSQPTLTLQIANVEEFLYQHLRSSITNLDADENPFVEYAIAPNTILDEGAVGIFAGFSLTEKVVEITLD